MTIRKHWATSNINPVLIMAATFRVVLFRSPYSSHTTHFKPKWEELVKHEDKVPKLAFAEVNCIEQGGKIFRC